VAFSGDLTCTFGEKNKKGINRKGVNTVYRKSNSSIGWTLVGIRCRTHIIHNAFKIAADCLSVDFECIIVKIYSFFFTLISFVLMLSKNFILQLTQNIKNFRAIN